MDKGKSKKKNNYLSIMLVPHDSGKIKSLRLSSFYTILRISGLLVVTALICGTIIFTTTVNENAKLKKNVSTLQNLYSKQVNATKDQLSEIEKLKNKDQEINKQIKAFNDKFVEMTKTYIDNKAEATKTNRSGSRNGSTFAKDFKDLQGVLTALEKNTKNSPSQAALKETETKLKKFLDTLPTTWPVRGDVTSEFGNRSDPISGRGAYHEGVDLRCDYGDNIKAAASGTVVYADWDSVLGRLLIISHGNGIKTKYGHTSKLLVEEGDTVKKGEVVARVGSSGRSTGPHLHFEIMINGESVDPLTYLDN